MTILDRVIKHFSKLPGLGKKSASRIAYFLLQSDPEYIKNFANDLINLKEKISECSICGNYTEENPCPICSNPNRNHKIICVVAESKDIFPIEQSREYMGVYHVLKGVISPLNGIGPDDLRIQSLIEKIQNQNIDEIIIATNPTLEGETTALYLAKIIGSKNIKISRLASGLPVGGDLEYADSQTISRAFQSRSQFNQE